MVQEITPSTPAVAHAGASAAAARSGHHAVTTSAPVTQATVESGPLRLRERAANLLSGRAPGAAGPVTEESHHRGRFRIRLASLSMGRWRDATGATGRPAPVVSGALLGPDVDTPAGPHAAGPMVTPAATSTPGPMVTPPEVRGAELRPSTLASEMTPYIPGKPARPGQIKLASNENPMGCSQKVVDALRNLPAEISSRYPDPNSTEVVAKLAAFYGVAPDRVVVTVGSNEALSYIAKAFLQRGRETVFSAYPFATWPQVAKDAGATLVEVPSPRLKVDLLAMRTAITDSTHVVYVANPGNPTGTHVAPAEMKKFIESVPKSVAIVLDAAYEEYVPAELQAHLVQWVNEHENLIVTQTLSKAWGLAGHRVGYAITSPGVADTLRRVRPVFLGPGTSQVAALAALDDPGFVAASVQQNNQCRADLCSALDELHVGYENSVTNFVLVRIGGTSFAHGRTFKDGADFAKYAEGQGIILRPVNNYGLNEYIRISIGNPQENAAVIALFQGLGGAKAKSAAMPGLQPPTLAPVVHAPPQAASGPKRIAVIGGAGSIGGSMALGVWLGQAAHRFALDIVVRPGRVAHYEQNGITVRKDDRQWTILPRQHPATVRFVGGLKDVPDAIVLNAVRNDQLDGSLAGLKPRHTVFLLQNGLGHLQRVQQEHAGMNVHPAISYVAANQSAGAVQTRGGHIKVGTEPRGIVQALRQALAAQDIFSVEVTADMDAAVYAKAALNCFFNPLTTMLQTDLAGLVSNPRRLDLLRGIVSEVLAVGKAADNLVSSNLDAKEVARTAVEAARRFPNHRSSMQEAFRAGRPTEIPALNGFISSEGKRLNIPTPLNDRIVQQMERFTSLRGEHQTDDAFYATHGEAMEQAGEALVDMAPQAQHAQAEASRAGAGGTPGKGSGASS